MPNRATPNHAHPDLDSRIADAERMVIDTDAHFLRTTGELATTMRGRAGRVVANSAITAGALLAAVVIYRIAAGRREPLRHRRDPPTTHDARATPPPPRSRAAGFLGETLGSALRAGAAPRPRGVVSVLAAPVLTMLLRRGRRFDSPTHPERPR